ncbi:ABC transporter permease [Opitutus terrae]|uniref:Permease n=1 Tax=Opitutus terrae (strain DSM 11246 / JCM 15787 / PB90-1) TaxID=452637 RepID=B1ZXX0_OPITP|nr:ABC transporter permease [Opitutus terrae]ACB75172.1 permease [Opitutus terrae PB90-1]
MFNLRYAFRSLLKSPGFALIAIVTLALGIGVNSSMYSLMNTLMFASAPFPRPESIVNLNGQTPQAEFLRLSVPEIEELRAHQSPAFAVIAMQSGLLETVTLPGQLPESMQGNAVDAALFKALETPPLLGRTFSADECVAGRDAVVLITENLWRRQFGANPEAVGQTMRINGRVFTIIGVLPEPYSTIFMFGEGQYFRPLVPADNQVTARDRREFGVVVRLTPGVTPVAALASIAPLAERWAKDHPRLYQNYHFRMQLAGRVGGSANVAILTLQIGLAAAILAIACANLANLQMARAASRLRDLAIRSALGASRWRLIRQQLVESLLLSVIGGALGLLVAHWSNLLIGRNIRLGLFSTLHLPIDGHVLAFNAAISIVAGLGFGLVPAWLAARADINDILKQQTRGTTGGRHQGWIRGLLVVGQVALSLALLSVAGMMIYGLDRTLNARPSWDTESILTANLQVDERSYNTEQTRAFQDEIIRRLSAIPGVEVAAIASTLPIGGSTAGNDIFKEGQDSSQTNLPKGSGYLITPGFFKALGIRVLEGQTFPENVSHTSPERVVVNKSLADNFWPKESAIGKRLGTRAGDGKTTLREVIGVVADVEDAINFTEPVARMQYFTPMTHTPWSYFQVVIRGPNPKRFDGDLRRAIAQVSPDVAPRFIWTLADMRDQFLHNLVVINGVLFAFALLGLVLASVGLYGIVSHNVSQRMGEFGIRVALGARQIDVMGLVLLRSLRLTLVGLAIGAVAAYALGLALRQSLGPLIAQNYTILGLTCIAIFVVAFVATWLPARQAATADPVEALRAE